MQFGLLKLDLYDVLLELKTCFLFKRTHFVFFNSVKPFPIGLNLFPIVRDTFRVK